MWVFVLAAEQGICLNMQLQIYLKTILFVNIKHDFIQVGFFLRSNCSKNPQKLAFILTIELLKLGNVWEAPD